MEVSPADVSSQNDCLWVNPFGESYQLIVHFNFVKNGFSSSEAKQKARSEEKLKISIFEAKLRFALFASLRSAVFSEIKVDN